LELRAAELFVVSFVEPVGTHGVEDLLEWAPVAKDPDERPFAGSAVQLERNSHEIPRPGSIQTHALGLDGATMRRALAAQREYQGSLLRGDRCIMRSTRSARASTLARSKPTA